MTSSKISTSWRAISLSELCQVDRRLVYPSAPEFPDLPYVGLEHIEAQTGCILQPVGGGMKSAGFRFDNRHVLYGRLRPYLNKVAIPDFSGRCSSEIIPILPRKDESRHLVACALRQSAVVDFAVHNSTGSRMPRIDINRLLEFSIYVPDSATERKRLGNALSANIRRAAKMQTAMQAQAEAIAALPESILSRAFPRKPKMQLGDVCEIVREKPSNYAGEKPYYSTGAIATGKRGEGEMVSAANRPSRANILPSPGDVGFAVMKNTAKAVLVDAYYEGAIFSTGFCFLRPSTQILPEFLFYWVSGGEFQHAKDRASADGIMSGLGKADTLNLEIPVPPLSEQRIIARMLKAKMKTAAKLNAAVQAQLDAVEALPGAWLRRAFSEQ